MLALRDYQKDVVQRVRAAFARGHRRVCAVLPCGAGKTVLAAAMARGALEKGHRVLFLVHRRELLEQTARTFRACGLSFGVIAAGARAGRDLPCNLASVATLARRLASLPAPQFIVVDECHHVTARTYLSILEAFPRAFVLGLTATPARLGGQGLSAVFDALVVGATVKDLIQRGALAAFRYYAPPSKFDPARARVRCGDYVRADLLQQVDEAPIVGDVVAEYQKHAAGKRAIVYCVSRAHAQHVAAAFAAAGIAAAAVDGETAPEERRAAVRQFRAGKLRVLCNCELFGEGFDVPALDAVILARPTKSLTLFLQQATRAMRIDPANPGKEAIIIDHVGNVFEHGLPDEDRTWRLTARKERKKASDAPALRICPACFAANRGGAPRCCVCGQVFTAQGRDFHASPGELVRIEQLEKQKRTQQRRQARTLPELLALARARGYSRGWAWHVYKNRRG